MDSSRVSELEISSDMILAFQATLLAHPDFHEGVAAYVTDLALKLNFDRVSLGVIEDDETKLVAISNQAHVKPQHETSRLLVEVLNEAISQNVIVKYPDTIDNTPRVVLAHSTLARHVGNQVFTIPLSYQETILGAICFERENAKEISLDEISACEQISQLIAPVIQLKFSANFSAAHRAKKQFQARWKNLRTDEYRHIRIALYLSCLALFALMFVPIEYHVSAPARLEGLIQRALVASDDGFLQQSYVRPGDKVKENQMLAELSDQELLLEKQRWESELAQFENAYGTALAGSDRTQVVMNQAKMAEAKSKLVTVEQKIERTKILAPFDGIIIKGDLKQSLGAPVQRGDVLLTISPVDKYRLIVEVDERDVSQIATKKTGTVALVSLPGAPLPFVVQSITPVANTKDGHNYFDIEGSLTGTVASDALHPGLEGVAKIEAGRHTLFWILTHRIFDWIKLTLWSWGV